MAKKKKSAGKHTVRGAATNLELASVGHAVNLRVYRDDQIVGRLHIGQGGLNWVRKGKQTKQGKKIPWAVFETIMKEWPFGHRKRARLKFVDGAMRWRRPNMGGAGRRVSWDEFVDRMEGERPKASEKGKTVATKKTTAKKKKAAKKTVVKNKAKLKRRPAKKVAAKKKTARKKPPNGGSAPPPSPEKIPGMRHAMREVRIVSYKAENGDELWLNNPGSGKRASTPIIVHAGGVDVGTVDFEDLYWPAAHDERLTRWVVGYMREFLADPEHWIKESGRRTGYCAICGHKMWRKESLERGIGPVCAHRIGYLSGRMAA